MKRFLSCVPMLVLILTGCNNPSTAPKKELPLADTAKFYPLRGFLQDQIRYVDLRNFPIHKITIKNGVKDSVPLTKEQFMAWAGLFLKRDLSEPAVKIQYQETVFQDQSTGSLTLNYTPVSNHAIVKSLDILLDEETHIVKRVFIRTAYQSGDSSITEQYSWKANKSFQVSRAVSTKKGSTAIESNFINWNDTPEQKIP